MKNRIESLSEEVSWLQSAKQAALEKYQTTEKLLEEFQMSRPMFDANQRLKQELEQATKDRDKYKFELYHEKLWKWSISEPLLEKANRELVKRARGYTGKVQSISPNNLKEMVLDVFHNPDKYIDTIMKLMEQYDLNTKQTKLKAR